MSKGTTNDGSVLDMTTDIFQVSDSRVCTRNADLRSDACRNHSLAYEVDDSDWR